MSDDSELGIKITAATDQFDKAMEATTSKTQGYAKDLVNAFAAFDSAVDKIPDGLKKTEDATEGVKVATAGTTREFIVLGHEVVSRNFSRIPGSLMVLAERMGSLGSIISSITPGMAGMVAVMGTAAVAAYKWVEGNIQLEDTLRKVQVAMNLTGQGALFNKEQQETLITTLRVLANASKDTANSIVVDFGRAGELSLELRAKLVTMVADFASATNEEAQPAAQELIKLFETPSKAAESLRHSVLELSTAQEEQIRTAALSGDTEKAQAMLFDALAKKVDDVHSKVGTFNSTLQEMHATWVTIFDNGIFSSPRSEFLPVEAIRENVAGLFSTFTSGQAKAEDGQRQLNNAMREAADAEKSSGLMLQRKLELTEKLQKLEAGAAAAEKTGNTADSQRWLAEAKEIQEQINNLRSKGQKQDVTAAMESFQEQIRLDQQNYDQKKELLDAEVGVHQIGKIQEINQLRQALDVETELQMQQLEDESRIAGLSVVERQRINDQMLQLQATSKTEMLRLDAEYATESSKQYDKVFNAMKSAMDSMVTGILQGTQTLQQTMVRFLDNIGIKFTQLALNSALDWAKSELIKTTATTAGVTERQSAEEAGAAASSTFTAGKMIKEIESSAATTYAGVFAYLSPTMGPAAAIPAGLSAGVVGAMTGLVSLDVGAYNLSQDTVAQLHQGEMVVPKTFAQGMREGGGMGGGGGDVYNITLQAMDTQTGAQFLKNNIGVIATQLSQQKRLNNPAMSNFGS